MGNSTVIQCVGRRHVEVSQSDNGTLVMEILWKEIHPVATLVFEAGEAARLRDALVDMTREADR